MLVGGELMNQRARSALIAVNNFVVGALATIGDRIVNTPNLFVYALLFLATFFVPYLGAFLLTCLLVWALNRHRLPRAP